MTPAHYCCIGHEGGTHTIWAWDGVLHRVRSSPGVAHANAFPGVNTSCKGRVDDEQRMISIKSRFHPSEVLLEELRRRWVEYEIFWFPSLLVGRGIKVDSNG